MPEITRPELEGFLFKLGITATTWQAEMLLRLLQSDEPVTFTTRYRDGRQFTRTIERLHNGS